MSNPNEMPLAKLDEDGGADWIKQARLLRQKRGQVQGPEPRLKTNQPDESSNRTEFPRSR